MSKRKTDLPSSRYIESNPYVAIGVAVVRRALQDLTIRGIRRAKSVREDALEFLTKRLWEPSNLWQEVLSGIINKRSILLSVKKRCLVDEKGKPTILRKK